MLERWTHTHIRLHIVSVVDATIEEEKDKKGVSQGGIEEEEEED